MPTTPDRSSTQPALRVTVLLLVALLALVDAIPASSRDTTALALPAATPHACTQGMPSVERAFDRSILTSVVTDGAEAWTVGMTTLAEDPRYALALEWDGTGWPVMSMRRPKAEQALFALDRGPRGSLWAAGYRSSSGGYRPMLMRLTQGRWIPMRLGASGRRTGVLTGIAAVTDRVVWAVGYRGARGGQRPFAILHTDSGWSEQSPPLAGGSDGALMDVDAAGGEVWAVGWVSMRGAPHPYAARRAKAGWQVLRPPLRRASEGVLTSVAVVRGGGAWTVGYRIAGGRTCPSWSAGSVDAGARYPSGG